MGRINNQSSVILRLRMFYGSRPAKFSFTLVELMVVVAIVLALLGLLLPGLKNAKCLAYSVSCKSNLRQVCVGTYQYMGDFDGRVFMPDSAGTKRYIWHHVFLPYIVATRDSYKAKDYACFTCTEFKGFNGGIPWRTKFWHEWTINRSLMERNSWSWTDEASAFNFKNGRLPYLIEMWRGGPWSSGWVPHDGGTDTPTEYQHLRKNHCLYTDGSIFPCTITAGIMKIYQ